MNLEMLRYREYYGIFKFQLNSLLKVHWFRWNESHQQDPEQSEHRQ